MALTTTPAPELGALCPDFVLPATDGRDYTLNDFENAKALVVMFICNHCPYVQAIEDRLIALAKELMPKQVAVVGICSNDSTNYPDDSFENLKKRAIEKHYPFPYLYDQTQEIAKKFGAVCTPDFFVYDSHQRLAYRGRLDDSWKDPSRVQKQELKEAVLELLNGGTAVTTQNPSMGCSIKWVKE